MPRSRSLIQNVSLWAPPFLWAAFIFYLSGRTSGELPQPAWNFPGADKAVHFALYAILGMLLARACRAASNKPEIDGKKVNSDSLSTPSSVSVHSRPCSSVLAGIRPRPVLITIALGVLYAATDELHQAFVPTRHPDIWDFAADAVGIAAGCVVWIVLSHWFNQKTSRE